MDLILLFAAMGAVPCAIIGGIAKGGRGVAVGAVADAILGPLIWIAGVLMLWPGV
jgi:hypothetical protein